MKPFLIRHYLTFNTHYDKLLNTVPWINQNAPRDECFMALKKLTYTYGKGFERTYKSVFMDSLVYSIMELINKEFLTSYNVCFLNHYADRHQHLGWHADDSPELDADHPIAVLSFGATRQIWVKEKDYSGEIPDENKYELTNGSLFIMPKGFQEKYVHKIPKHDRECGGRISLTYRRMK